jgi:hypothetical protein
MPKPQCESFPEYYDQYKEIIDKCIPKAVLNRLLNRTDTDEQLGDAWESGGKYYDESGEELPF